MIVTGLSLGGFPAHARRWAPRTAAAMLAIWYLLVVIYAVWTGTDFVSRDQWHFIPLVDHYLSGTFAWGELWDSHTEHVKPAYKLLFLLNARYLGLDMRVEIMAGIALLGIATWLLLREMRRSAGAGPLPWLAWLVAGLVMMSFDQVANYGYGLLALGGFGNTLVQLALFIGFAHLLQRGLGRWETTCLCLLLLLGVFGFSGARSPAVVGACLAAALSAYLLDPAARARILRLGVPFLALGVAAIGMYLLLLHLDSTRHLPLTDKLRSALSDPLGSVVYLSGLLLESMLALTEVPALAESQAMVWVLTLMGYALLGWCLWRYFRAQHWRKSWVPLMLIAYSALFALEVLIGRYGSGQDAMRGSAVPRYVFDTHLWLVACVWILGLDWAAAGPRVRIRGVAVSALLLVLVLEGFNLRLAYAWAPFQAKTTAAALAQLRAVAAGREAADALPKWICPDAHLCQQGIATLSRYHLDFARDTASK